VVDPHHPITDDHLDQCDEAARESEIFADGVVDLVEQVQFAYAVSGWVAVVDFGLAGGKVVAEVGLVGEGQRNSWFDVPACSQGQGGSLPAKVSEAADA